MRCERMQRNQPTFPSSTWLNPLTTLTLQVLAGLRALSNVGVDVGQSRRLLRCARNEQTTTAVRLEALHALASLSLDDQVWF